MKSNLEATHQKIIFEWAEWNKNNHPELDMLMHTVNEGKRSTRVGAELKRLGMKAGVPDLLLLAPKGKYIGLAIEMKYCKNKCTIEQVKWLDWLYKQGYMCKVCWSSEEAIAVIKEYLGIK